MKRLLRGLLVLVVLGAVLVGVGTLRAGDAERSREQVLGQLAEMKALLAADDAVADDVSAWSVHQHVEHLLLANEGMAGMIATGRALQAPEPKTMLGRVVLMTGFIPRGKGQAPDGTVPEGLSRDDLLALHARAEQAVRALDVEGLTGDVVGDHPVFGGLTARDWLRFMSVHDHHHLKIVRDIQGPRSVAE